VEELQIDWLSSEDLKEEKVVSAPKANYKPSRLVVPKFRANNHAIFVLRWFYITNRVRPCDGQPLLEVGFDRNQNKRQKPRGFRLILLIAAG
jgi:hypothetical protein